MRPRCIRCQDILTGTTGAFKGTWHGRAGFFCGNCAQDLHDDAVAERMAAEHTAAAEPHTPDPTAPF